MKVFVSKMVRSIAPFALKIKMVGRSRNTLGMPYGRYPLGSPALRL